MAADLRNRRFLITGGGGFLGAHLCRRFLDGADGEAFLASHEVICLDYMNNGNGRIKDLIRYPGFRVVKPGSFIPDELNYILHFGSYPSPKDHLRFPLETLSADSYWTMEMMKMAHHKSAVFMLASTGHIDMEHDPTNERAVYAEGKRFAEAYAMAFHRQYGSQVRIIRMFNSYGPGMRLDDGRVVPAFIVKALRGEPLTILGGEQKISLTYVDDMVDAIERVLYSDLCVPVEIGGPQISVALLARLIITISGSKSALEIKPSPVASERLPDLRWANEIGWKPAVGIEEGLERTISVFREAL